MINLKFPNQVQGSDSSQEDVYRNDSKDYLKNYDPMLLIYDFIRSDVIQKYNLLECFKYEDEDDNSTEFFIKLKNDLSFHEKNKLRSQIRKDIENYCFENDLIYINNFYIYLSR